MLHPSAAAVRYISYAWRLLILLKPALSSRIMYSNSLVRLSNRPQLHAAAFTNYSNNIWFDIVSLI